MVLWRGEGEGGEKQDETGVGDIFDHSSHPGGICTECTLDAPGELALLVLTK